MSYLGFIVILISLISVIPYLIVVVLKFLLWKFSFTARVNGFFSFREIMLRVPLHLNFSLLLRIERVDISFALNSRILKLSTYGFQVNLLIRNDFNLWTTKKIEILQMLEDIRTSLKRKGALKSSYLEQAFNQSDLNQDLSEAGASQKMESKSLNQNVNIVKKTLFERVLDKLLSSFEVDVGDTMVCFYAYKDEEKKIEEGNVKTFYNQYLLDPDFRNQYLCFRVFIPQTTLNIKQMNDEELEIQIKADSVMLQHPVELHKQGILKGVSALLKVPFDPKLAQDFCNYDLRINIMRGTLNLNKKFIRSITKFVVYMDTLKVIIKRIKRLITKMNYQDDLLRQMMNGENPFERSSHTLQNVQDVDIPKRLKVVIEEGLTIILSEHSKKLRPFLSRGDKEENRLQELVIVNTNQITFELLRTLKNSYYITAQCDKLSVDCNMKNSITVINFNLEMDFSYKKSVNQQSDHPLRVTQMEITNTIRIEQVEFDLTLSEMKLILDIIDINNEMVCVASVKNKIMGILFDKEFLKNNLLHLGSSEEQQVKESQLLLLFQEQKHKDSIINDVFVTAIKGKISTYDVKNHLQMTGDQFFTRYKQEKGIEEIITKIDQMNVQPINLKQGLSLINIQNFENQVIVSSGNEKIIKDISMNCNKSQISKSRIIVFRMNDFKTNPLQCPFKQDDRVAMCYVIQEFEIYHAQSIIEDIKPGEFYCIPSESNDIQNLFQLKELLYKMILTTQDIKMKYELKSLEFNLPDKIHLGAIIHEIVKQIVVSIKWFQIEYNKLKRKYNIHFIKPQPIKSTSFNVEDQQPPRMKGKQQTLYIKVDVQEVLMQADENAMKLLFVNKNEIVDTLKDKSIFRSKPPFIFKVLKRLKQSRLNEKSMIIQVKKFQMTYDMPEQFLDFNHVYQIVQRLDEARSSISPILFKNFDGALHNYKAQYVALHGRSLLKPVAEIWDFEMKFIYIVGFLNANQNPQLFKTKIIQRVFNKYEVGYSYNKLVNKEYFDAEVKINKIVSNIQGQQSVLFLQDMETIFNRFDYTDLSKSRDKRAQKYSYSSPIDVIRYKMHGKTKFNINQVSLNVYTKRKFGPNDSFLTISFQDINYSQINHNQEMIFRNLLITKSPLRYFESAIAKIPLIEIQLNMIYNQGRTQNHFVHNGVMNIGQLMDQLKAYSSTEVEIDSKINIPSLGTRNDSESDETPFDKTIPLFVEKSPIPIMHYQRSHMRFFDDFIKEYTRVDYSKATIARREQDSSYRIKNKRTTLLQVKIKSLINDFMVHFTDFKEKVVEGCHIESNNKKMDQRNQKIQRDKYLALYQGIMFTMENLCLNTMVTFIKQKDGTHVELRNSGIQGFKSLREVRFMCSLENYKTFCAFFDINQSAAQNLSSEANQILTKFSIKTMFPWYILKNIPLQQEIIIATLNPNLMNPFNQNDPSQNDLDNFVFANNDTIGTIIEINYCQDKEITFYHNLNQKMEIKKYQQRTALNPLLLDMQTQQLDEERYTVKHMFGINGIRFLFTKFTIELITNHLVRGFNYKKFRQTNNVDDSRETKEYQNQEKQSKKSFNNNADNSGHSKNESYNNGQGGGINVNQLKKVALIGIRLEDPQINFQNEFTKSQMLLSIARPTTAVIFGYHKFDVPTCSNKMLPILIGDKGGDNLTRLKSGYQLKFHEQLVKYDLQIFVVEMDVYVAPTIINLENPTFWISDAGQLYQAHNQNESVKKDLHEESKGRPNSDRDHIKSENLLRKIFAVTNISFTFDFLKEEFFDKALPEMSIDILVEKLESELNGPNMWHFIYVLKNILFDRGQKPEEIIQIEKQRTEELQSIKLDMIKSLIDYKVKRILKFDEGTNSRISKMIQYTILNGELKLHNVNTYYQYRFQYDNMFSQTVISKVTGTHLIYSNRDSKVDIDIDKILIENYADSEAYRMVLFPAQMDPNAHHVHQAHPHPADSMIKLRMRDKYVVVKDAPWRIFDQFEIFVFPTSICLTRNFYEQFKNFFFADMPAIEDTKNLKKYDILVPQKLLKKAKNRFKPTPKDKDSNSLLISIHDQSKQVQIQQPAENFQEQVYHCAEELDQENEDNEVEKKSSKNNISNKQFPIFFRYVRLNELEVSITYYHNKSSFLNSKNLMIKLGPFIRHGKFVTFKTLFQKYQNHCKKNFISQLPSLIKQKFLQTKETFKSQTDEDDDDEQQEIKKEMKLNNARRILFGEFAE